MTEKVADGIAKGATLARNATNSSAFLKDAKEASEVCQKFAASSATNKTQKDCDIDSLVDNFSVSKDYTDCIVASAFVFASGGSFAAGKIRSVFAEQKVARLEAESQKRLEQFLEAHHSGNKSAILATASRLDDAARFKAAEAILGRELTLAQKRAVLKAHEIAPDKGFFEYSPAELKEKIVILTAAGIGSKEANSIMRSGITGKFSGENAKLAESGLLDSQMKQRNTLENLSSYEDDFKSQSFARSELDKSLNRVKSEIDETEKKLKNPNISEAEKSSLESKLEQLTKTRSETFKKLTEGTESISDHISDTRSSVIKKTDEIDRIRSEFYGRTGKSLSEKNPRLVDRLTARKNLFETEGFLEVQRNAGDPSNAIAAFRRATKDLNEIKSMGITPRGQQEVLSQVKLRAVAQDLKGITGSDMQSLVSGKVGRLEKGVELVTGDLMPPKQLPIINGSKVDNSIWNAYLNLAKKRADQYVVSDLLDNPSFLKDHGIKKNAVDTINEIYVANKERAEQELRSAIEKFYSKNPSAAKEAMKSLLEW